MKQHLKLKTFYGKGQNAVYNQIWIALITYCLKVLLQLKVGHTGSLLELKSSLKNNLFKSFEAFSCSLFRKPTQRSKGRRKLDWESEFRLIEQQFLEGKVSHFDNLTYNPLFIDYKKFCKNWIRTIVSSTLSFFIFERKDVTECSVILRFAQIIPIMISP